MQKTSVLLLVILVTLFSCFSVFAQKKGLQAPKWAKNLSIYEVNLRQYSKEGTINEFRKQIPRLKDLGAGILWLMPVHPIGEKNRKGTLGSYYSVKNYLDIDPNLGTKEDFAALVKEAHTAGMYVILDWVANHTAWDHPWMTEHPDFYTRDSLNNFVPPVPDWHDVVDLNYNNKTMRGKMLDALVYWVKEFGIDGYRCDVAGMVPTDFWETATKRLNKIKPVFMLAEADAPELHQKAFHMSYSWRFHHLAAEVAQGKKPVAALFEELAQEPKKYPSNAILMRFTSNHDENSWNGTEYEKFGAGADAFAVLMGTVPGMQLVYSGQEAANTKRLSFFDRDPIPWQFSEAADVFKKLNRLKREEAALWNGSYGGTFEPLATSNSEIIAFKRKKGKSAIITIINCSAKVITFTVKDKKLNGNYLDAFRDESVTFSGKLELTLAPWEYHVWVQKNQ